jgi:NodT family efflux transporter outer membrane factor (OMF) lipoprotein
MTTARAHLRALYVLAIALLGGCTVGPDFKPPPAPEVTSYTAAPLPRETASADVQGGAAQRFVQDLDLPTQWWTLFRSEALTRLVNEAVKANATLRSAQAALRQANELALAQRGLFYPTVQAGFGATRQRDATGTLSPNLQSGQQSYSLFTPQVTVSYVPDVFGANRRQVESLEAQAEALRFQLHAAYVTLTSNVVTTAIQEAALRGEIKATEDIVAIQREQLKLNQKQFDFGAIPRSDVVAQEALLAQTLATLPNQQKQLAQLRHQLTALLGRVASDEPPETFDFAGLELPVELPTGIPARLVQQRPDVRAAEAQLHAASAEIGVTVAAMLPATTITAGVGGVSTDLLQVFKTGNTFWSVGVNILQTLFSAGTLAARKRAAEAAFDQAAAQYRVTVVTAYQNVADVLKALQFDAEALRAQSVAERAAAQNLEFARRSVALGATTRLPLLAAQQTYQQSLLNLAQARANRYSDTAALFQALGGGWWNSGVQ